MRYTGSTPGTDDQGAAPWQGTDVDLEPLGSLPSERWRNIGFRFYVQRLSTSAQYLH